MNLESLEITFNRFLTEQKPALGVYTDIDVEAAAPDVTMSIDKPVMSIMHEAGRTDNEFMGRTVAHDSNNAPVAGSDYVWMAEVACWVSNKDPLWNNYLIRFASWITQLLVSTNEIEVSDYSQDPAVSFANLGAWEKQLAYLSFEAIEPRALRLAASAQPDIKVRTFLVRLRGYIIDG